MLNLLIYANEPDTWSCNTEFFPYYIQGMMELGEHEYDFSFLREALEKDGSGAKLVITEDMEDMILYRMTLAPEVFDSIEYDSSVRDSIIEWSNTTDCTVIMLYGGSDVWYQPRIPDVPDRDNFHTYVDENAAHSDIYSMIDPDIQEEIDGYIDAALAS